MTTAAGITTSQANSSDASTLTGLSSEFPRKSPPPLSGARSPALRGCGAGGPGSRGNCCRGCGRKTPRRGGNGRKLRRRTLAYDGRVASNAPIFVIGFQRSGTTLLQALIGAHSRIAAPPETYYFFRVADQAAYFGDLSDSVRLRRALEEALEPPLDLFSDCGFDMERIYERARRGAPTYGALFDAIMSDF